MLRLVHRVLEGFGYRVLHGRDGRSALAVAEEHAGPLHLLLTDVVMPGMTGPELAELLRKSSPTSASYSYRATRPEP